jgi:hypothetical protein
MTKLNANNVTWKYLQLQLLGFRSQISKNIITQYTRILTYSMEQGPSWEANWFAASQEIPRVLWNPKVPHRTHKRPPRIPILSQPNPVFTSTSHFLKIETNVIPIYAWVSPAVSFPQVSPSKSYTHLSLPPYVLHAPPISFFSILSPAQYWLRSTDHSAPHYVIFSIPRYLVPLRRNPVYKFMFAAKTCRSN